MKNFLFVVIIISIFLSLISCEEDINPFDQYREKYVLNCILRGDSTYQFAAISKSYLENGNSFDVDPSNRFLTGADIRIWHKDDVFKFKDSTIEVSNGSGQNFLLNFYYTENFIPEPGNNVEIEALLTNGRRLKSKTTIPKVPTFEKSVSDTLIPPAEKDYLFIRWSRDDIDLIYASEINIYYFKKTNGVNVRHIKKVPLKYLQIDERYIPIFPQPSTSRSVTIEMDAMNRVMHEISEGDPVKDNYTILTMIIDVHVYDANLSNYYITTNQSLGEFTVQLDEIDFSNVEGGFGIFGSFFTKKFVTWFDREYIHLFGYKAGIN